MSQNNNPQVPKKTLIIDKVVSKAITFIGMGIIIAVLLIIFYLALKIIPLFQEAKVSFEAKTPTTISNVKYLSVDEWNAKPTLITPTGVNIIDAKTNQQKFIPYKKEFQNYPLGYSHTDKTLIASTKNNQFNLIKLNYKQTFDDNSINQRQNSSIHLNLEYSKNYPLDVKGKIVQLKYESSEENKLVVAVIKYQKKYHLKIVYLTQKEDLFGDAEDDLTITHTQTIPLKNKPQKILLSEQTNNILVLTQDNSILSFCHINDENKNFALKPQKITPFIYDTISSLNFVYGSNSFICTSSKGKILGYSFVINQKGKRVFFNTKKEFQNLQTGASYFNKSTRNKVFIIGDQQTSYLMNLTTQSVNWHKKLTFKVQKAIISPKYDKIYFLDKQYNLHTYSLDDPHPEASIKTYFSKIWYESKNSPEYTWQSTGGSNQAETKLSMVPLIFGTIKATFYTMLFSVPLALLAAIFTSQFANWRTKSIVKPIMEIMATLPSVVVGFIGALWFGPLIYDKVLPLLSCFTLLPLFIFLLGYIWSKTPKKVQLLCKQGNEYIYTIFITVVMGYFLWQFGYFLEDNFFLYQAKGETPTGDFARWWIEKTGLSYEQKNALIVGISMGFAVIPIIFTIAEESLSNVPKSLTSASLALGASRWQTTWQIILPSAIPGIFSAMMIGFGRAVGETMIVLCAAGGTAIIDANPFNGMRTLSMNLAIELPEAPLDSTLFRSLYLGATLLFGLTFIINTLAEIIRHKIRKKYEFQ